MELVSDIHEVNGIDRIRIGSIEPTIITDEFAETAAHMGKLCPHYHISLQSGCDETLSRMNRRYTATEYKKAVELLREKIPDVAVTTDVMVGFPGETDEEFKKTFEFLAAIKLAKMHVFKFSPRKGTPAASFEGQVEGTVKEARSARLLELSENCALNFNSSFIGRTMPVLYEQEVKGSDGFFEGLTPNYIRVLSKGNNNLVGNINMSKLLKAESDHIVGEIDDFA